MMLHTSPCSPIRKAQVMHSLVVGGIFPVSLWFGKKTRLFMQAYARHDAVSEHVMCMTLKKLLRIFEPSCQKIIEKGFGAMLSCCWRL